MISAFFFGFRFGIFFTGIVIARRVAIIGIRVGTKVNIQVLNQLANGVAIGALIIQFIVQIFEVYTDFFGKVCPPKVANAFRCVRRRRAGKGGARQQSHDFGHNRVVFFRYAMQPFASVTVFQRRGDVVSYTHH